MPNLPVFSTVGQAIALFGQHFGKLLMWALIPLFLGGGAFCLAYILVTIPQAKSLDIWHIPSTLSFLFGCLVLLPFTIRVNQLAVLGRVEKTGYLRMMFSSRSIRYAGYIILLFFIGLVCFVLGLLLFGQFVAWIPGLKESGSVGFILLLFLLAVPILLAPFSFIFTAVSVEQQPTFGRIFQAFKLGWQRKFRLFLCLTVFALLYAIPAALAETVLKFELFGVGRAFLVTLISFLTSIFLAFFSYVTSVAVPAVAYRILSGLPDPRSPQAANTPGEPVMPVTPVHPGNSETGDQERSSETI